ncbi:MAG: hypothetical protein IT270_10025 [Saprospiraceae bacterium]|nr:hypothetical protein [Saprospiraceae bacterium]
MFMQVSKFLLPLCFVLFFSEFGIGQSNKADSTYYPSKWEVGLDLLGLFNEGNVPKASIFFRRNYARSIQKCKALRFRVGLDSEIRDGYTFDGLLTGEYTTYGPYLSLGHEWKQNFNRFSWYVATDLSGRYLYSNQYYLVSGNDLYYDDKIRNFDIALNGILGYQIRVLKNLSIGIESAIIVKYSEQHSESISNDQSSYGGDDYSQLTTSLQPFMTINLIYSLQKHKTNDKK